MKTKPARAVFGALFDAIGLPAAVSVGLHLLLLLLVIHIIPASSGQSTPTPAQAPVIFAHMVAAPAPAAPAAPAQAPAEQATLSPVQHQPKQVQQAAQPAPKAVTRLASQTRPDQATQQKAEAQTNTSLASATPQNAPPTTPQNTTKTESSSANALGHGAGSQIGSAPPASQAAPLQKARPNYAYNPPPDYPSLLQDEGIGGVVWMKVWVEVDGQPSQISVLRGSGYRLLDESARRAVQGWRFHPAKQGGQAFASWVEFPVRFNSQEV